MSYTSKYTGQQIDDKLDLIEVINQTGLIYKGVLNSANDLDAILENGIYYYSTNNLPLNAPYENAAIVLVFGTNSTTGQKIQVGIRYGEAGHFAFRNYYNSKWYSWAEMVNSLNYLDKIYPVGSVYMSYASTSPASLFGGTWTQIKDRFLLAAGDTYTAASTGGAATVTLTSDQMPSHTHTFTGSSATTSSNGAHTHDRGSMNITGAMNGVLTDDSYSVSGAFSWAQGRVRSWSGAAGDAIRNITLNAASSWTGSTSSNGAHTHTLTAKGSNSSTGGGKSHSNMPPYLTLYMWRRTA